VLLGARRSARPAQRGDRGRRPTGLGVTVFHTDVDARASQQIVSFVLNGIDGLCADLDGTGYLLGDVHVDGGGCTKTKGCHSSNQSGALPSSNQSGAAEVVWAETSTERMTSLNTSPTLAVSAVKVALAPWRLLPE
jgi:hypothetical protein